MSKNLQFDLKRLNWDQFALNNTLVSGTTTAIDSSSNPVTNISGITLSTQNSDLPSKPTSAQSDCMASINKRYESEGFSDRE
jgi:RecG-like helicase